MLMSQDNPKRLILSYQKVDITYIFHFWVKYMSLNYKAHYFDNENPLKNIVTTNFPSNTFEQI